MSVDVAPGQISLPFERLLLLAGAFAAGESLHADVPSLCKREQTQWVTPDPRKEEYRTVVPPLCMAKVAVLQILR